MSFLTYMISVISYNMLNIMISMKFLGTLTLIVAFQMLYTVLTKLYMYVLK